MEEPLKIDISALYLSLKLVSETQSIDVLDKDDILNEIETGSDIAIKNLVKFNSLISEINDALILKDIELVKDRLVRLSVESMNISSIFDNVHDDIDEYIKRLF